MDHDTASTTTSRRSLLAGAAGVAGAVVLLSDTASASPLRPTESDTASLAAAKRLELAVYELYKQAAGNASGAALEVFDTLAKNHEAYAEGIASLTGVAADEYDEATYAALLPAFTSGSTADVAVAAHGVELQAAATHTALLATYENVDALELTAGIITAEARHAALLADVAGLGANLDAVLLDSASPLDLTGGAE